MRKHPARSRSRFLHATLTTFAFLAGLIIAIVVAAGLFSARSHVLTRVAAVGTTGAVDSGVLHVRATRNESGARGSASAVLEAWLDLATNEGKIVESAPDGTVRRIEGFSDGTYIHYLGDARHAVIRRNVGRDSPFATRVRDELLRYRIVAQRGGGQIVGSGHIGERPIDRVRAEIEGTMVLADIDQATGLTVHEEASRPDGRRETRQTSYSTLEYVSRANLPTDAFRVDLPSGIAREEYTEGRASTAGSADTGPTGQPYGVYAASASLGRPVAAFRRASTSPGPGVPPSDAYYLIYQTADGEVQVISSPPLASAATQGKDPMDGSQPGTMRLAGVDWELQGSARGFQGRGNLGDAYVTIYAPNQAVFERVAVSLLRLDRQ